MTGDEQARKALRDAIGAGDLAQAENLGELQASRDGRKIASTTDDEELMIVSEEAKWHTASVNLINSTQSTECTKSMRSMIKACQDTRGTTFSTTHGDMRTYNGPKAAQQRAANCRLNNAPGVTAAAGAAAGTVDADCIDVDAAPMGEIPFLESHNNVAAVGNALLDDYRGHHMPFACSDLDDEERALLEQGIRNSLADQQQANLYPYYNHAPPPLPQYTATPSTVANLPPEDPTPDGIVEMRDEASMQVVLSEDPKERVLLQGVHDGFERPRDEQMVRMNERLAATGISTAERVQKLTKIVDAKMKRSNK